MAEVELKLTVPPGTLMALGGRLARYGRGLTRRVDTVYFDSSDHTLASIGVAVRLRRIGALWMQTLKIADRDAALSTRGEWEVSAPANRFSWARFPSEARRKVMARLRLARLPQLEPQFRTRFARTTWDVAFKGADVEIALDVGEIVVGHGGDRRTEDLSELELELKAGGAAVLPRLARRLVRPTGRVGGMAGLPLLPQPLSKEARGRRLVQGTVPAGVKADRRRIASAVRPSWTAEQALRAILTAGGVVVGQHARCTCKRRPRVCAPGARGDASDAHGHSTVAQGRRISGFIGRRVALDRPRVGSYA